MIDKINKIILNYKVLFGTNFYLNNTSKLKILLLSGLVIIFSFLSVYSSLPFLEIIFKNSTDNNFSFHFNKFLEFLNLEKTFFLCSLFFISTLIIKSILEIVLNIFTSKIQYNFMLKTGLSLNNIVLSNCKNDSLNIASSELFNLYTKELERSSDIIKAFFVSIISIIQIVIFILFPILINFKMTIFFLILLILAFSPFIPINYLTYKAGLRSTIVADSFYKYLNIIISQLKFLSIHNLMSKADNYYSESFLSFFKNKLEIIKLRSILTYSIQPIGTVINSYK